MMTTTDITIDEEANSDYVTINEVKLMTPYTFARAEAPEVSNRTSSMPLGISGEEWPPETIGRIFQNKTVFMFLTNPTLSTHCLFGTPKEWLTTRVILCDTLCVGTIQYTTDNIPKILFKEEVDGQ